MNSNERFILSGVFGLGYFLCAILNNESSEVQQPSVGNTAVITTPINTDSFLTIDDLNSIYSCVDTKISNQNNDVKFPCVKVRGD